MNWSERWEHARGETGRLWLHEIVGALVVAALTFGAVRLFGADALVTALVTPLAAVLTLLLIFTWNLLWAPIRLLEREHAELNARVQALEDTAATDVDVELRNELRRGQDRIGQILGRPVRMMLDDPIEPEDHAFIDEWTRDVARLLSLRDHGAAREFQEAKDQPAQERTRKLRDFQARVKKLEALLSGEHGT